MELLYGKTPEPE